MASLGSAILFVLLLIISGIVDHIFKYAFLAGILTGIMSSYYESCLFNITSLIQAYNIHMESDLKVRNILSNFFCAI